jgi:hypothetical protein
MSTILLVLYIAGCGSTAGLTTDDDTDGTDDPTLVAVSDIAVTATQNSINPGRTTTVTATVYSASGSTIPGATVIFTLDQPTLASITGSALTSTEGVAAATFEARSLSGEVKVYATVGSITSSTPATISILDQISPVAMTLEANPTSVLVEGTATLTATVFKDTAKTQTVENGTTVLFSMENELYGTVSSTSSTNNGRATATFEASQSAGFATINATSGSVTASIQVQVLPASAVAISFLSAEPDVIALKGSGGNEVSTLKFMVKDSNDQPVTDVNVSFLMKGPNGGEYIDDTDQTPNELNVSTGLDGIASVRLYSGTVAGPVTISGAIVTSGTTITSTSSVISIGGGVPSAKRFQIGSELINLPGFWKKNLTTDVSVYLADRFGNYNMLNGTSVSFVCESGLSIDTSTVTADDQGIATVTVRTQNIPEVVTKLASEEALVNEIAGTDEIEGTDEIPELYVGADQINWGFPRLGYCSVMAYTLGEEHFDDTNANGLWDSTESFIDTIADPFIDYNDDGLCTGPGADDPEEIFIDSGDERLNSLWDGNKYIFSNHLILITDKPIILFSMESFDIPNDRFIKFSVLICDINLNPPTEGTTLTVSASGGTLTGKTAYTFSGKERVEASGFEYKLEDDDSENDTKKRVEVKVSLVWEKITITNSVVGTIR